MFLINYINNHRHIHVVHVVSSSRLLGLHHFTFDVLNVEVNGEVENV